MPEIVLTVGDREFFLYADAHEHNTLKIVDAAEDIGKEIVKVARTFAPKRTGRLAEEGIDYELEYVTPDRVRVVAGLRAHPEYGIFVYSGTGIYGEFHRPYHAHVGNVMVYDIEGRKHFSHSVLGQVPHPFIHEAVLLVGNTYVPARLALLGEQLT